MQPVVNQGYGGSNMYSNNNSYGNVNNNMMYTGFPMNTNINQPQQGIQNTVIPSGFINTQPGRDSNLQHNTIYQRLNSNSGNISVSSSSVTTSFIPNTILPQPPQNLWNTMYGSQGNTSINTGINPTSNNPNPYGYSNTNVYPNPNMNANPYQNPYGMQHQQPNQNYMGNHSSHGNPMTQVIDPKQMDEEIRKILIAEIRINTESKIKEEIKRNKQQEDKLKNYKNEFNSQIEKYGKFFTRKEEMIKTIQEFSKISEYEMINIQNYLSKMQDRMMNSSNYEKFVMISNQNLVKIISVEATLEDFIAIVKKAFEKNILTFNETTKIIRNLTRECLKIKFYKDKLSRGLY